MKKRLTLSALRVLGGLFVLVGILGLFLPFLQGIALIVLGLYLLTLGHPSAHRRMRRHMKRAPSLLRIFDSVDERVRRALGMPPREE